MYHQPIRINLNTDEIIITLYEYQQGYDIDSIKSRTTLNRTDIIKVTEKLYPAFKTTANENKHRLDHTIANFIHAIEDNSELLNKYTSKLNYTVKTEISQQQLEEINKMYFTQDRAVKEIAVETKINVLEVITIITEKLLRLDNTLIQKLDSSKLIFEGFKENYYSLYACIVNHTLTGERALFRMGMDRATEIKRTINLNEKDYVFQNIGEKSPTKIAKELKRGRTSVYRILKKANKK